MKYPAQVSSEVLELIENKQTRETSKLQINSDAFVVQIKSASVSSLNLMFSLNILEQFCD